MIAVISPAKSLDYKRPIPTIESTRPHFEKDAEALAGAVAKLSAPKLRSLMGISDKLARLNVDRFRGFGDAPERPALYAFAGDVYAGFEVHSLDQEALSFARDHLRVLSGLYGLLRPFDAIRPYRLEMGTRWASGRARNLYAYWGDRIAGLLRRECEQTGARAIINLASKEYWQAVEGKLGGVRVIEIDFREEGPDGVRFNSFAAKRARGMMARYICEHHLVDPDALKEFDSDGYSYDRGRSDENRWRFCRA
jgi:cytoplasmic iron level regulating protein YaaA (DUF328/UPF0246 family)